jgi:hypothetical protein
LALGNIAGDSTVLRDYLLDQDIMEPLLLIINENPLMRNATWTLFNLCRGKPYPTWELVSPALPTLSKLIHSVDSDLVTESCWTILSLTENNSDNKEDGEDDDNHIQAVMETAICPRLIELMTSPSINIITPALGIVANMLTGTDEQIQVVVGSGALPVFCRLLDHPNSEIRKVLCWALSNIMAGTTVQIIDVIQDGLIPPLLRILSVDEMEIRKEACWAIVNSIRTDAPIIKALVARGVIKPLCDMLLVAENSMIRAILYAIKTILKVGEQVADVNEYALLVEECGGMDYIYALQTHENVGIYQIAYDIIDLYFHDEDDTQMIEECAQTFSFENHIDGQGYQF